ncbi:hypothetical protein Ahy_A02g007142 [Arachis hypogaea]|uniref:Aminotransferase-like plant mobile domain-containing protein n=1 Tax=Arachis hypogaea TaxID=3818 RepID=A0A445EBX1_ARAHY|nr:hypothetical protein Ahy_A02g007142 [Arachis hypogaea]
MRRQQGMRLDDRYVPYLQMAGLYHLARLNDRWFQLDEPLVSAFVERWRPETHTFHMPFGECTIMLQDVAYQLGLAVDGRYGGRPAWVWFEELLGVIPPPSQMFVDKSGNRIHIRWLPYVARLEEMGSYSWGSAALAWLYRCMCRVANRHVVKLVDPLQLLQSWIFWCFPKFRPAGYDTCSWPLASRWSGYNPSYSEKGPRVQMWRLKIDMLQPRDFIWMPYSSPEVLQVVHPEALEPRHTAVWRSIMSLIYFAVIEWHQIDKVLPQFGGVQLCPRPALNINFLMSKVGRGGDRWFPAALQHWHFHWESCADHVLRFDVVADPGPSLAFLDWWSQHGKRFLSPETYLRDPRGVSIPVEVSHRGPGRVPDMDRVDDVPDRRRVERRARVGTRRSQREWRLLEQAMGEADEAGRGGGRGRGRGGRRRSPVVGHDDGDLGDVAGGGGAAVGVVSPHHGRLGGEGYAIRDPSAHGEAGLGEGLLRDYFVGVPGDDHTLQKSTPWVSPGSTFLDFLAGVGLDADFGGSPFLDDISALMQDDEAACGWGQTTETQPPLHVDLNEPPFVPPSDYFALGGTPASAHTAGSHSVAEPSSSQPLHVQPRTLAQPNPQDEDDEIKDEEPLIRRGQRTRVPHRCFTGSHLFR